MALRDVLAELAVKVDVSELQAADALIDRFIGKVATLSDALARLKFPKMPASGDPAAPSGGRAPGGGGVATPTLPSRTVEEQLAERNARVVALLGDVSAAATPKMQALQDKVRTAATRLVDLNTKVENNRALQARFQEAMTGSAAATAKLGPRLAALQSREFELVKAAKAANEGFLVQREALEDLGQKATVTAPKLTMLQRIMAKLGSPTSRMADGQIDPGASAANNLKQAAKEGDGLFAVLGRLRKIWGLLQFGATLAVGTFGFKTLVNEMDEASKSAAALGMQLDDFQVLSKFAELGGASVEQMSNIYLQLARNVRLAGEGGKVQQRAFKQLEVDTKGANGEFKNTVDLMFETYDALSKMTVNTDRLAIAQQLMGKESVKLLPAFAAGKKGALEQLKVLRELTVAYDQESASAAEAFNDTLALTLHQLRSVAFQGVSILLPHLLSLVKLFLSATKSIKETIRQSSLLQTALAQLALVIGGALMMKLLGTSSILTTIGSLLARLAWLAVRFVLPLLMIEDVVTFLRGGDSLLGRFLDKFKPAGKDAKQWLDIMWNGLKKAQEALGLASAAFRVLINTLLGRPVNPEDVIKAERFQALFKEIATKSGEALMTIFGRAIEVLQEKGYGLGDALKIGIGLFIAAAPGLSARILGVLGSTLFSVLGKLALRAGLTMATSVGGGFLSAIGAVLASPVALIIAAFAAVAGLLYLLFTEKGRAILYRFGEILVDIVKIAISVAASIGGKIGEAIEGLVDVAAEVGQGIKDTFFAVVEAIQNWISNISFGGIVDGVKSAYNAVKGLLGASEDELSSIVLGSEGKNISRLRDSDIAAIQDAGGRVGNVTNIDNRKLTNSFSGATPAAAKAGISASTKWFDNSSYLNSEEVP